MKKILITLVVFGIALILSLIPPPLSLASFQARSGDALHSRIRSELRVFTGWLSTNNVQGYIGEFGWPDNSYGDSISWNALADDWLTDADASNLWATGWATGTFWTSTYKQLIYKKGLSTTIDTPSSQAAVLESHPPTASYKRGINVAGGEFSVATDGSFSNHDPGTYATDYIYDPASTFTYLASRGFNLVRLPIRWERIQPTLGSALSTTESARLQSYVARAGAAGLGVVLDIHNYGGYYLYDGSQGVLRKIGSQDLPESNFIDLWTRLSTLFKNDSNVLAYGLMNEPNGLPSGFTVGATRATFDTTDEGWVGEGATSVVQDGTTFRSGTGALKATKVYGSGAVVSRFNDHLGSSTRDLSANGLSLSGYVYIPSAQPGTGWQARFEVQKPDFTFATGTVANLTKGSWTNITYTMTASLAASMRAIVVQLSGNNVNATASAWFDDFTQGTSQTSSVLWQNATQDALNAIRANGDTKLIMIPGYNHSGVQNWTTSHPIAWITDSANNFRYEAHHYWDSDNSGTYASNYVTTLASAISAGYTASGSATPSGSMSVTSGATTSSQTVTLALSATDDADSTSTLQMEISNLSDFSDASWSTYATSQSWVLTSGNGSKTVYARFKDYAGNISPTYLAMTTYTAVAQASSSNTTSSTNSTTGIAGCSDQPPGRKAPELYAALPVDSHSVTLYFTDADGPLSSYVTEYGTNSNFYSFGSTILASNTRIWTIGGLSPGVTYYFRVRGGNGCATGPWSNEISVMSQRLQHASSLPIISSQLKATLETTPTSSAMSTLPFVSSPQSSLETSHDTPTVSPTPTEVRMDTKKYSLNVKVTDGDKKPVEGATVTLHSIPRKAVTNENGVAAFSNVEGGQHTVLIVYNNASGEENVFLDGSTVKTFDLSIQIKPTNPFLSPQVMIVISVLGMSVIILVFIILRRKKKSSFMPAPAVA